ncbi:type VI secretion system baseplate subunit TssE [Neorhodopirellula lusitana]|uniref:type VI secretion system baseplate subunit TssE n=1 Tax=Neorhodopirellula lusitana TaxID=445327 RepID=UPI003851728C
MSLNEPIEQPSSSLLDRLIRSEIGDGGLVHPRASTGSSGGVTRQQRRHHMAILSSQIERDLLALFGTRRMSEDTDLSAWPLVQKSVLNYGIPDLTGVTSSGLDLPVLNRELTEAIRRFEPRLRPETLNVSCHLNEYLRGDLIVKIEALFGPSDALEAFAMGISICLGSGQCQKVDPGNSRRRAA